MSSQKWLVATLLSAAACVCMTSDAKAQAYFGRYYNNVPYNNYASPYDYNYVIPASYYAPNYSNYNYSTFAAPNYNPYYAPTTSYQNYYYSNPFSYGSYRSSYQSPSVYGPGGYSYRYRQQYR